MHNDVTLEVDYDLEVTTQRGGYLHALFCFAQFVGILLRVLLLVFAILQGHFLSVLLLLLP